MKYLITIALLFTIACQPKESSKAEETPPQETPLSANQLPGTGFIERTDDALDALISREAKLEILADGFDWTEGPLWLETEGVLLFSDIPPNTVYRWHPDAGVEVYLNPSGYTDSLKRAGEVGSNGLLLDGSGKLILCQHGDRRLARMQTSVDNPQPRYQTVVDKYQGKKLNSPNDAVLAKNGDLYFTDPPYGLEKNMQDPLKELTFQGVYRFDKGGKLQLLTDQLSRPNGIALSPDQSKLYVANSDPQRAIWMEYNLQSDGSIDQGRVFYDATQLVSSRKGLPDGMKVHPSGNIFATGPGGVLVFNAAGKLLGTIMTGEATSNCALGNNNKYLYITADMYLMRIALL